MYYEDENNLYHYSYRKGDKVENVRDVDYTEVPNTAAKADPWEEKKPKKNRLGLKIAALALACALIYMLAWKGGVDPVRIILSGVAINSVLSAYNSLLQLLNSDSLEGVLAFMNGSLSGRSWQQVKVLAVYAGIGLVLSFACIKSANTLQLGDEMAKSLGVKVSLSRVCLSAVSAFLAAATISASVASGRP